RRGEPRLRAADRRVRGRGRPPAPRVPPGRAAVDVDPGPRAGGTLMPSEFDEAVGVEPAGPGRFRAGITDRWNIGIAPNGGYLVTVVLSAIRASVARPDPVAGTAHFVSRTEPGPAEIEVEV